MSELRDIADEYPMVRVLSASPQCTVYESARPADGGPVVVKLIAPPAGADPQRGRREFNRAMGALQFLRPSGFPELYDFGLARDGSAFMVMERVDGASLGSLAGGPPERSLQAVLQVAATLEALSRGGVFHHNLSPDNVLVVESAGGDEATIVGFGTAAFLEDGRAGALLGHSPDSDRFTAPERFDPDRGPVGVESDLYSLALITCELLGAEVGGLGSSAPTVTLPEDTRARLGAADRLESLLAASLCAEPSQRHVTYPKLGEALWTALPATVLGGGEVVEPPPEADTTGFDPNKTDPALDPAAIGAPVAEDEWPPDGGSAPPPPSASAPPAPASPGEEPEPLLEPAGPVVLGPPRTPWALVGAAVASVVLLAAVTALTGRVLSRAEPDPEPPPVAELAPTPRPTAAVRPTATPAPLPVHPALLAAAAAVDEGDMAAAEAALDEISDDEVDALREDERELYDRAMTAIAGANRERTIRDLRGGLEIGSIRMLRRGVAGLQGLPASELEASAGLREDLEHAREALRLHAVMWKAHDAGDHAGVLAAAAAMIESLPEYSTPYEFRDEAAQALEAQAEGAASSGRFETALEVLEPVRRFHSGRDGLDGRLQRYRDQLARQQELAPLINRALAEGDAGRPEQGLGMLAGREPVPGLERRLLEARASLETRLAELDAEPPAVVLKPGTPMEFRKSEVVVLPLEVSDDYRVEAVRAMVRPDGAAEYREVPVRPDGEGGWVLEVPVDVHGNESLDVYVEAEDRSGHVGRLGAPEQPLRIEKKGFFKRIFGG